jgi:hypothetical protein
MDGKRREIEEVQNINTISRDRPKGAYKIYLKNDTKIYRNYTVNDSLELMNM